MINKNEIVKCKICKNENEKNVHYCTTCGNNLSDMVELTDIVWSINKFINVLLIIGIVLFFLMILTLKALFGGFGANVNLTDFDNSIYLVFIGGFIGNYLLKKYTIRKCKKNLDINKEVRNEKN